MFQTCSENEKLNYSVEKTMLSSDLLIHYAKDYKWTQHTGTNDFGRNASGAEAGLEEELGWGNLTWGSGCWDNVSNTLEIIASRSPSVSISIKWSHDAGFVASLPSAKSSSNSLNSETFPMSHRILIVSVQKGVSLLLLHLTPPII